MLALLGTSFTFLMTALGTATVFFFARKVCERAQGALLGFAAGVMMAASVWSLILPAIKQTEAEGRLPPFLPAAAGIVLGALTLFLLDELVRRRGGGEVHSDFLLLSAITLHNIPEGMAVGLAFALAADGESLAGAFALALGIGVQNFPEGAIISLPLRAEGAGKGKSFLYGVLSGVVEPIGGAAVRRARRARGGGNPRADAVASELCSGGDALRRGGGAAAARGRTAGDVRLPRGLPSDDDTGRRAGVSAKNPA